MNELKKPDAPAALVGALLTIASALHLPERTGVTVDEMGVLLGAIITIAATVRAVVERKRRSA